MAECDGGKRASGAGAPCWGDGPGDPTVRSVCQVFCRRPHAGANRTYRQNLDHIIESWVPDRLLLGGLLPSRARFGFAGGLLLPSFGRKLFMLAHASISLPSTERWSPTTVL